MRLPSNGVIYVDNSLSGSCSGGFVRTQNYSGTGRGAPTSCENAWVSGTYSSDLTIAADNDVIVEDDITRGGDGVLLGLIANNFVGSTTRWRSEAAREAAKTPAIRADAP
jgi:hypothetical protein